MKPIDRQFQLTGACVDTLSCATASSAMSVLNAAWFLSIACLISISLSVAQTAAQPANPQSRVSAELSAVGLPANTIPVPLMRQSTDYTCGVASLQAILAYYGQDVREDTLSKILKANHKYGTRYNNIAKYAESRGIPVRIQKGMSVQQLQSEINAGHPVLCLIQAWADKGIHTDYASDWNDGHYVVAVGFENERIVFMDPSTAAHYAYITVPDFEKRWHDVDGHERLNHFGMTFLKNASITRSATVTPLE